MQNANTNNNDSESDKTIQQLRDLLGHDVVLLPVVSGKKYPTLNEWQKITLSRMSDPDYLAQFSGSSIGVLLGAASGGLCAIDIDDDSEVEPFLQVNPALRATLRSKGARGAQIWVRIDGAFPKQARIKTEDGQALGEWRSDGAQSVIQGLHPSGVQYQILNRVSPVTIKFDQIQWPAGLKLPWVKDEAALLAEEHGDAYMLSDKGNLQINEYYFVARFQREHKILWEPLEEEFYQYDSTTGLWESISEDMVKWQFGRDLKRAADEARIDSFLWKRKNGQLSSFVTTLRGLIERRDAFKKQIPVIHLANGMLDLQGDSPQLKSFHPEYYSRNACPLTFDPVAECPRFIDELLRSALGQDDIDLLQKWSGSVLLGDNPAQRVLLLTGTAGGGKSTVIEIIEKIIGERNVAQLRTKHLNKQFELYRFLGKTLLTGKDVDARFLSQDGAETIKALVGNDLLDAEKKFGNEQFQLRGNFNVAITCNSKLRVKLEGDASAWQRRLMIIDYSKPKPKQRITQFAEKLITEEGAGILNWTIEGAIRYLEDVEGHGDFVLTEEQQLRVTDLLAESDSVRHFVHKRVVECETADITFRELQQDYFDFCENFGWAAADAHEFRSKIEELLLEVRHVRKRNDIHRPNGQQRGFKGITVLGGGQ